MPPLFNKEHCSQKMFCKKDVMWLTPYVRTFLLLFVCAIPIAAEAAPQSSKWQVSPTPSTAEESLTLSLKAEKAVEGWMKTSFPVLTIQCVKGKASVYVETGMALEVTVVDKQLVNLQLDDNKPFPQSWREVTNATISARDAATLIKRLAQSRKLIFEFSPFGSAPVQTEFAVAGLSAYLPQLAKACWEK